MRAFCSRCMHEIIFDAGTILDFSCSKCRLTEPNWIVEGHEEVEVKRHPVTYRFDGLNWDFIKMMAEICYLADQKYGSAEQYADGELKGEKSPLNHIPEHLRQYVTGEPHDYFEDPIYHLVAIAYNAMMQALYHRRFGHRVSRLDLSCKQPTIKEIAEPCVSTSKK